MTSRRRVLASMTAAALASFARLGSAQPGPKRVGVYGRSGGHDIYDHWREEFPKEFEALGYVEGRNFRLQWFDITARIKGGEGPAARTAAAKATAADMAAAGLDCGITHGEIGTRFLLDAAPTLPLVVSVVDPVQNGFAKSLARPGGTTTGIHSGDDEVAVKTLELLRKLLPGMTCIAHVSVPAHPFTRKLDEAARSVGLRVRPVMIDERDASHLQAARREFASFRRDGCLAAHLSTGPGLGGALRPLGIENRIALLGGPVEAEGFLLHYGPTRAPEHRTAKRIPAIVARILRGEKPADIPFEGPSSYELFVNMKTAQHLGIAVPADVQLMATQLLR